MHERILMESPKRWDIAATKSHQTSAKMRPNGIIQTFNAVKAHYGEQEANRLLRQAGLEKYIAQLPHQMVNEQEFHNLVRAVCETFEPEKQKQILLEAGERTEFFQALLKRLPTRWAAKLLLWAIKNMLEHLQAAALLNTKSQARLVPKSSSKQCHIRKVLTSTAAHCSYFSNGCSKISCRLIFKLQWITTPCFVSIRLKY